MKAVLRYTVLWVCILFSLSAGSQNITLKLVAPKKSEASKLNYKKKFQTKEAAYQELSDILLTLQYKGYLLASADTIYADSSSVTVFISDNKLFRTAHLRLGNLNPNLASKLGISEKLYFNRPFKYKEVAKNFEKILEYYENTGYPFAAVSIDSVVTSEDQLSGVINVQKNKLFKIDSIKVMGTAKVSQSFLRRYLSVKEGMVYNEEIFRAISQKVKQLPFVTEQQPQVVRLTNKTNKLILFLDKKNASQFDGIIGLLPDATTKKTVITGDVKLKLANGIFRSGETFNLEWRRLQSQTQDANIQLTYPYLFGTPLGVDYNLKIYRKDTSFIDINNNFGLQYYFNGLNSFKIFYRQRNTSLISSNGLSMVTTLPDYADITTQSYGAGVNYEKLDYRFNPHRGISLAVNAQTGNRVIKKNPKINEAAYDGLLLRSTQYQVDGVINWFIQLHRNNVLRVGVQGASVFGNSTLFRNELFRIGGLKTLRGFDEETIYTSTYVIPTVEYRFLFAQNSNLLLFAEGAWYENNSQGTYIHDTPMSIGAGVNFETKAGILTLDYAIGNQFGSGFDARSGKIHFGLTALF